MWKVLLRGALFVQTWKKVNLKCFYSFVTIQKGEKTQEERKQKNLKKTEEMSLQRLVVGLLHNLTDSMPDTDALMPLSMWFDRLSVNNISLPLS